MRPAYSLLVFAVLLSACTPTLAAQSPAQSFGAVARCTQACDPREMNGVIRTGSEPVWTVLYAHVDNILNRAPLNSQPPHPMREPDRRLDGRACLRTYTNTPADFQFEGCEITLFASPGLVEYEEGGWRTHQEPGLAYPVRIVGDTMTLYLTLSTSTAAPNIAVSARVETGRHPGRGVVIAESDPDDPRVRRTLVTANGDPHDAWEIAVPMKVLRPEIPATATSRGYIVAIRVFQLDESQATSAAPTWQWRVGHRFPPRLVFQTAEPMRTEASIIAHHEGATYFRWSFAAALGTYDIDDSTLQIRSTGRTPLPPGFLEFQMLKRSIDWDGHFKPMNATWRLNHSAHALVDGPYRLTASATNLAGTYRLDHHFDFEVRGGAPQVPEMVKFEGDASPGLGAAWLLALIAVVAAWRKGKGFQPPKSG